LCQADEEAEPVVAVDRKLQRAVKNRLSAARSRERRLAYTAELEAQVAQLQAENEELRRQLATAQAQR
jgi:hypothetical protein